MFSNVALAGKRNLTIWNDQERTSLDRKKKGKKEGESPGGHQTGERGKRMGEYFVGREKEHRPHLCQSQARKGEKQIA